MAAPLSNADKNRVYGRPGAIAPVNVTNRLKVLPRRSDGKVQVVLAHPLIADVFVEAYNAACAASPGWVPGRCDSVNIRAWRNFVKPRGWKIGDRGTSNHAWGLAFDIFSTPADVYPPGGVWEPHDECPPEFVAEFTSRGFVWGGDWRNSGGPTGRDTPHFEYASRPPVSAAFKVSDPADWLTEMLKQGDVGPEVRNLQFGLMMLGFEVPADGVFSPAMTGAVKQVQEVSSIKVDGIVGPQTEGAFVALWAAEFPTAAAMVERAYRVALDRAPDAAGGAFWEDRAKSQGWVASQLLRELWDSDGRRQEIAGRAVAEKVKPSPVVEPPQAVVEVPVVVAEARRHLAAARKLVPTVSDELRAVADSIDAAAAALEEL